MRLPMNKVRINRKDLINTFEDSGLSNLNAILAESKDEENQDFTLNKLTSLEMITKGSDGLLSRNFSRADLSINNYDKSINEVARLPSKLFSFSKKRESSLVTENIGSKDD